MPKKQQGRKPARKVTRRKRKSKAPVIENGLILEIDQVYKIINKVQLTREPADFVVRELDAAVAANILRDSQIPFTSKPTADNCTQYFVSAPPERKIDKDFEEFEIFPDEVIEDGQVFF